MERDFLYTAIGLTSGVLCGALLLSFSVWPFNVTDNMTPTFALKGTVADATEDSIVMNWQAPWNGATIPLRIHTAGAIIADRPGKTFEDVGVFVGFGLFRHAKKPISEKDFLNILLPVQSQFIASSIIRETTLPYSP